MIVDIIGVLIARQHLERLAATPATLTVAQAAADIRQNYAPIARQIDDRLALIEKTQAQVSADDALLSLQLSDSIFYSNDVNARIAAGATRAVAVDAAFNSDADATRKARWTLATVRALFGL